ncbi:MAG: endonuclease III [Candidatus Diapherotrites archaeon]|nr:endonuclease III [Candidatus Diapherotrites archaeon]
MVPISLLLKEMRSHSEGAPVVGFSDPFKVLISTVLSQRTKDANTAKASKQLFSKYSNPKELAQAPLQSIEKLIKPAGFYHTKAKRIKKISASLIEKFGGSVPNNREQLVSLAGIGPKTAGCVIVYGFQGADLPVDTHVHRISNRLGLVETKTPEKTELALKKAIPRKHWAEINHLMVRFGQKICLPRNPRCTECGLKRKCVYYKTSAP